MSSQQGSMWRGWETKVRRANWFHRPMISWVISRSEDVCMCSRVFITLVLWCKCSKCLFQIFQVVSKRRCIIMDAVEAYWKKCHPYGCWTNHDNKLGDGRQTIAHLQKELFRKVIDGYYDRWHSNVTKWCPENSRGKAHMECSRLLVTLENTSKHR